MNFSYPRRPNSPRFSRASLTAALGEPPRIPPEIDSRPLRWPRLQIIRQKLARHLTILIQIREPDLLI